MVKLDLPPKRPATIKIVGVGDEGSSIAQEMRLTGTEHVDFILETEEIHARQIKKRLNDADMVFFFVDTSCTTTVAQLASTCDALTVTLIFASSCDGKQDLSASTERMDSFVLVPQEARPTGTLHQGSRNPSSSGKEMAF
ncbi:MAG: hypothetical protein GY801_35415 [bacterium]|nr:hypothetical protein [bacterium]